MVRSLHRSRKRIQHHIACSARSIGQPSPDYQERPRKGDLSLLETEKRGKALPEVISVETVLNSRCSSDSDGDPKKNHWGSFINGKRPEGAINHMLQCCEVPRFSDGKLTTWFQENYLFLGFDKAEDHLVENTLHIESGMQHEAVHLACAALGVGTCIHNMGVNGTQRGEKIVTARHLILEMADCYENGKYTGATPGPETPFRMGKNLPEPKRTGDVECLPELRRLRTSSSKGPSAGKEDISQLLWAAKGITPHYVKGHPWGLTIPTWGHGTEYTSVYLVKNSQLFRYVNWTRQSHLLGGTANRLLRYALWKLRGKPPFYLWGNPTHDIDFIRKVNVSSQFDGFDTAVILSRNERTNRALWEVGYMLENMLLQSSSLGVSYKTKMFNPDEISQLGEAGVKGTVAALLL